MLCMLSCASAGCPTNITGLRSNDVVRNFDPVKMVGLWYEQAYHDPAQIGASCQTLNFSSNATTGGLVAGFAVKYPFKIPFTIDEYYLPAGEIAHFTKEAAPPIPGQYGPSKLVPLDTVVVDMTVDASGQYTAFTMYSCLRALGVDELVIATRSPTLSDEELAKMTATAAALGVPS